MRWLPVKSDSTRKLVRAACLALLITAGPGVAAVGADQSVETPFGAIKARSRGVPMFVPGIPEYPRGHRTSHDPDGDGSDLTLRLAIISMKFVALRFETGDSPDQVAAFYQRKLAVFGTPKTSDGGPNTELDNFKWASRPGDRTVEVDDEGKVHLVALRPKGKGCQYALLYMDFK